MKLLIFHTGLSIEEYKRFFALIEKLNYELIGFTSLNLDDNFKILEGYTIYPADAVVMLKFDKILIDNLNFDQIATFKQIFSNLGVPPEKTSSIYWLVQQAMTMKYEDFPDSAIQETLTYWKNHELNVFNQHTAGFPPTMDEVHVDESCGLPYINFKTVEGKERRMYYPKNTGFFQAENGKSYVHNVLIEQVPNSPHLYIKDDHKVEEGDVLIDAGVCEGNFALRYVDICAKVYLLEPDRNWFEPLYYSFRDCWNKIDFIPRFVGEFTRGSLVALDDVVNVPIGSRIFLKMDVEGAEPAALRGAKKILSTNKVKASICSYHNADDLIKIKSIFKNLGYKTGTSEGYMVFIHDYKFLETLDFRKGIVYAKNY